jgi:hypothetical protein
MGDLGLYDSDLQVRGHSRCFLLNVAPHPFGGPVEAQKVPTSSPGVTDVVSMSIFQWTIVVLTPGTGPDGLAELVASSVICGQAGLIALVGPYSL